MLKLQRGSEVVQAAALRLGEAGWQHLSLPSSRARQRTVTSGAASLGGGGRGLACGSSSDGTSESVGIDLLNVRLQRRHAVDAMGDGGDDGGGLGMLPVPRVGGPSDGVELQTLLDGIHQQWKRGRLKYDIRHFMANFSMMVAAQKDSPTYGKFMAYVSAAIFKILPGEL